MAHFKSTFLMSKCPKFIPYYPLSIIHTHTNTSTGITHIPPSVFLSSHHRQIMPPTTSTTTTTTSPTKDIDLDSLWFIHGKAFDLRAFAKTHPGGSLALESVQGMDCTQFFEAYHFYTEAPRALLKMMTPVEVPAGLLATPCSRWCLLLLLSVLMIGGCCCPCS